MALNIKFSDKYGEVFSWDDNLPLISESTAESHESDSQVYYQYSTITFDGVYDQNNTCSDFPPFYSLASNGTTGVLEIGASSYSGYWTGFTADSEEIRWNGKIPYTATFTTFPDQDKKIYDGNYTSTLETLPYDPQYGPAYKVTVDASSAGLLLSSKDDTDLCNNVSLSGARRGYTDLNSWYSDNITADSYFGYSRSAYEFYDLQGSTSFDDLTGEFAVNLSWVMRTFNNYDTPYYIIGNYAKSVDANMKRKIEKQGTIYGFSTGVFPASLPFINIDGCKFRSSSLGFATDMKYKHALMGLDTISDTIEDTATQDLLPEDSEWHGGQFFPKANAPSMSTNPAQSEIGYNPYAGTINYSYTFDDQPESLISSAIVDSLTVRDKKPKYKTELISVIGRRHGPIVRTSTFDYDVGVKTVTYEGVFPRETTLKKYSFRQSIINQIDNELNSYVPTADNVSVAENTQNLNLTTNKVTRTITWNYSDCSS